ncbi:hypothetical protein [Paraglaciecola arctica]|uniref:Lipoprotein n=1 Tax=Paraglaciecola arctica BSs20135 TaxID=493475 RepID=K6YB25_9ALTE|nr:hypothetical protein [Paraglaciecola arctica]GAC21161.1 hypothetical protein GARC_4219 [Paraglaciecola arctica BSs20135]
MQFSIKVILVVAVATLFAGCTKNNVRQFVGSAVADGADTEVKYNALECRTLQQRCVQGDFQEWETSNKDMGCSCKKL